MSDATPAPWVADFDMPDFVLDHPGQHPCIYGSDKVIASVGNMEPWGDVWEEWRANARIIAAAPALLKALTDITERADEMLTTIDAKRMNGELSWWQSLSCAELAMDIDAARAALARASNPTQSAGA